MAVYGYCRVSTDAQADEGESLGVQERRIRGQAMADGLEVDAVFVDRGVSGSVPWSDRPEGARLFELLGRGRSGHRGVARSRVQVGPRRA